MKKRFLSIMLVMILAVTNLSVCYADGLNDLLNIGLGTEISGDLSNGRNNGGDKDPARIAGEEDTATGIIKTVVNILTWIPKAIINLLLWICQLILPTMDVVVFNEGASIWRGFLQLTYFDDNIGGELAGNLRAYISALYQVFRYVALIGFVVAIACIAVKMIFSSIGKQKQQYKEALKSWLIGLVLLVVGHWIMIYAIYFSDYLVDLLRNIKNSVLSTSGALLTFAGGGEAQTLNGAFANALGSSDSGGLLTLIPGAQLLGFVWAVIAFFAILAYISMNLKIFKIYFERVVIVGVLIILFPLVTVFYAFEKAGLRKSTSTFQSWLRTFVDQVFIQPVHALSLLLVILVLDALANTAVLQIPIIGVLLVLIALNLVFSIENVVKRVFAINGAALGRPIDAMSPIKKGMSFAAPAIRHGINNAMSGSYGKGFKGFAKASKDAVKDAGKYLISGDNRNRLIGTALESLDIGLPQGVLGRRPMSMTEQRNGRNILAKIMGSRHFVDSNGKLQVGFQTGQTTWDTVDKMMNHLDPDIVANLLKETGLTKEQLRRIMLNGTDNEQELLATRVFAKGLLSPEIDVSSYKTDGNFDGTKVNSLGMDDDDQKNAIKVARKLNAFDNQTDRDEFATGFYRYALNRQEKYEKLKSSFNATDEDIKGVLDGSITDEYKRLKVQAMAECMLDSELGADDFYVDDIRATSGNTADRDAIIRLMQNSLASARMTENVRTSQAASYATGGINGSFDNVRILLEGYKNADKGFFNERIRQVGRDTNTMNDFLTGNDFALSEDDLRAILAGLSNPALDLNTIGTTGNWDFSRLNNPMGGSNSSTMDYQMSILNNVMRTGVFDATSLNAFNEYTRTMPVHYHDALQEVNSQNYLNGIEINEQFMNDVFNGSDNNPNHIAAAQLVLQKLLNRI